MNHIPNKKERLIEAATTLIYEKGFANTTLAEISKESGVPLGNVYYYFKSKESLAKAVIESRQQYYRDMMESLNKLDNPLQRLTTYLGFVENYADNLVEHGCPVGSLSQELEKSGEPAAEDINELVRTKLAWIIEQFVELGVASDKARSQAIEFLSNIQGATVLSNSLNDKSIILDRLAGMREKLQEQFAQELTS